jgi:hypothetical protein
MTAIRSPLTDRPTDSPPSPLPREEYWRRLGEEIGKTVAEKQGAYGDSLNRCGNVLREMYPDGIRPHQYADLGVVIRIIDKCFRIATNPYAFEESPGMDIAGYGLLAAERHQRTRPQNIPAVDRGEKK